MGQKVLLKRCTCRNVASILHNLARWRSSCVQFWTHFLTVGYRLSPALIPKLRLNLRNYNVKTHTHASLHRAWEYVTTFLKISSSRYCICKGKVGVQDLNQTCLSKPKRLKRLKVLLKLKAFFSAYLCFKLSCVGRNTDLQYTGVGRIRSSVLIEFTRFQSLSLQSIFNYSIV